MSILIFSKKLDDFEGKWMVEKIKNAKNAFFTELRSDFKITSVFLDEDLLCAFMIFDNDSNFVITNIAQNYKVGYVKIDDPLGSRQDVIIYRYKK